MIAEPNKSIIKQRGKRKPPHPNSLKNLEKGRIKPGEVRNPLGKPLIKTDAVYWRKKYLTLSRPEIEAELKKPELKAIQIAVIRDVLELMKDPHKADKAWDRLREAYQRDEPLETTPPMPDIHITIVRE